MPVFKCNIERIPEWCEVEQINLIKLESGESVDLFLRSAKCKLFFCEGSGKIISSIFNRIYSAGEIVDMNKIKDNPVVIVAMSSLIVICIIGNWEEGTENCGTFTLDKNNQPQNIGDQVDYKRNTDFDNHFHDCDEYWIIYRGKGKVVTEGIAYEVGPGDCVATRMGDHHDFPEVYEKIHGVYFETTLKGKKTVRAFVGSYTLYIITINIRNH